LRDLVRARPARWTRPVQKGRPGGRSGTRAIAPPGPSSMAPASSTPSGSAARTVTAARCAFVGATGFDQAAPVGGMPSISGQEPGDRRRRPASTGGRLLQPVCPSHRFRRPKAAPQRSSIRAMSRCIRWVSRSSSCGSPVRMWSLFCCRRGRTRRRGHVQRSGVWVGLRVICICRSS